jgi:hypothetical protein
MAGIQSTDQGDCRVILCNPAAASYSSFEQDNALDGFQYPSSSLIFDCAAGHALLYVTWQ